MNHNNGRSKWKSTFLPFFLSILIITLLTNTSCNATLNQTTWPYSEFVQAVEQGEVESVNIAADRSQATFTTQNGEIVLVNLPNDSNLISTLQENNVEIFITPQANKSVYDRAIATFLVPIIFLVSLSGFLFWIWMLIDCATKEPNQGNTKIVWILIIMLVNLGGALIYFFVRRPQRQKELGS